MMTVAALLVEILREGRTPLRPKPKYDSPLEYLRGKLARSPPPPPRAPSPPPSATWIPPLCHLDPSLLEGVRVKTSHVTSALCLGRGL